MIKKLKFVLILIPFILNCLGSKSFLIGYEPIKFVNEINKSVCFHLDTNSNQDSLFSFYMNSDFDKYILYRKYNWEKVDPNLDKMKLNKLVKVINLKYNCEYYHNPTPILNRKDSLLIKDPFIDYSIWDPAEDTSVQIKFNVEFKILITNLHGDKNIDTTIRISQKMNSISRKIIIEKIVDVIANRIY